MEEKNYTVIEAAKEIGIDKETLRKWIKIYEVKIDTDEYGFMFLTPVQVDFFKKIKNMADQYPRGLKGKHQIIKKKLPSIGLSINKAAANTIEVEKTDSITEVEAKQEQPINDSYLSNSCIDMLDDIFDILDLTNSLSVEHFKKLYIKYCDLKRENARLHAGK